jgi:hypothetical protein
MIRRRKLNRVFGIFCAVQVVLFIVSSNVCAPGNIYLTIQPEPPTVNINQSNEPLIMGCTIHFEGVSVLPYTVYVDASCDVGEVYLTQYQFVFHYTETIPFDAIIFIDPETENNTQGELVLWGHNEEGGVVHNVNPVFQIIEVLNYDPNQTMEIESIRTTSSEYPWDPLFLFGLPSLLVLFGVYIGIVRPRLSKKEKFYTNR